MLTVPRETMGSMTDIPYGYCHCGCGELAPIAPSNEPHRGYFKGKPRKYVSGHNNRRTPIKWIEEDRGYATPCWVWQWHTTKASGHGQMVFGKGAARRSIHAHKFYWEQKNGPVPEGYELHHCCEVPACVNPDHLEPVTKTEHRRRHSPLTEDDVREIRRRYAVGERQKDIGADYGITQAYVSLITTRQQWADVL